MNWEELLQPFFGGPGESPGREAAVRETKALVKDKKRLRELRREEKVRKGKGRRKGGG